MIACSSVAAVLKASGSSVERGHLAASPSRSLLDRHVLEIRFQAGAHSTIASAIGPEGKAEQSLTGLPTAASQ